MKQNIKKSLITACALATLFNVGVGSTSYASTVKESPSHASEATAQEVTANNETAQSAATGKYEGQTVIKGKANNKETDWYKVYLKAGTNYLSLNGGAMEFYIKDASLNTLKNETYTKSKNGMQAFSFIVNKTGYYYVGIIGRTSADTDYSMTVGSPTFSFGDTRLTAKQKVSLTRRGSVQSAVFDFSSNSQIPVDAIATSVLFQGLDKGIIDSINLCNQKSGNILSISSLVGSQSNLASYNMPVKSKWVADFTPRGNGSFTPVLSVHYVYPIID